MAVDYIPETDSKAAQWMKNFSQKLVADAGVYHVTPETAAAVTLAVQAFRDALAIVQVPRTRTSLAVLDKNLKRKAAEKICRRVAQGLRANDEISDAQRYSVGLNPPKQRRRRVAVPKSEPTLAFLPSTPGFHKIRYRNALAGPGRALPKDAVAMQLFEYIVDDPNAPEPTNAEMAKLIRLRATVTSNPFLLRPDRADAGKKIVYFARWVSRRGEPGVFGPPLSINIAV